MFINVHAPPRLSADSAHISAGLCAPRNTLVFVVFSISDSHFTFFLAFPFLYAAFYPGIFSEPSSIARTLQMDRKHEIYRPCRICCWFFLPLAPRPRSSVSAWQISSAQSYNLRAHLLQFCIGTIFSYSTLSSSNSMNNSLHKNSLTRVRGEFKILKYNTDSKIENHESSRLYNK